jgi:hypothetical protein
MNNLCRLEGILSRLADEKLLEVIEINKKNKMYLKGFLVIF